VRRYPLGNHGLAWVLAGLWLTSWAGYYGTQYAINERYAPHEAPYWLDWLDGTLENAQSEFLQLLTITVLGVFLIMRGAPESRDSDDELNEKVDRILDHLEGR
jgi:hypothetical protein